MITPLNIRLIPFFHSFEEAQLRALCPYFIQKKYLDGEIVLQQNRINTKLYFLTSGAISIFVNDQFITDVSERGEVLGEMSIANHSTCSATVKAKGDAEFLIFSFEDMRKSVDPAMKDGILKNFYKGTMEILAAKLINSNKRR